ncbi:ATP-binding protein [Hydromonas duriensis]|uniref:ATP-binding protein n=1 Tax=Hydromonas duriensis TaxID=1527608 RepID=UPI0013C319F1|nr:ATP-binding protein [Hydromonas duriensis]
MFLVIILAGVMHYIVRDGFGDYVAHVKLQRLAPVQKVLVQYVEEQKDFSGLKMPGVWESLILAVEEVKREEKIAKNQKHQDKTKIEGAPEERRLPPPVNEDGGYLPPYVRGVALLDANADFVAGEPLTLENAMRFPIKNSNNTTIAYWLIRKGPPDNDVLGQHFLAEQVKWSFLLLTLSALISAVLAWLLAGYFKKPMAVLQTGFRRVAAGDLATRLPVNADSEMGEIQRNFNSMTAQLEAQESARRQWVADTSHELRTPLTILRMRNEAMRDGIIQISDEEWQRNLSTISDLTVLIDDLQSVARATESGWDLKMSPIHVQAFLEEALQDNMAAFTASGLTLKMNDLTDAPLYVSADAQRLHQVLRNVLLNSLRYTDAPGETLVEVSREGKYVKIELMDTAPGVSEGSLQHLFERFYRCEGSRNRATGGSGLGLAICEGIVKAHHGKIHAQHSRLGGLSIVVELPLHQVAKTK